MSTRAHPPGLMPGKFLDRSRIGYLIGVARQELSSLSGRTTESTEADPGNWHSGFVNVTLRRRGLLCGSMDSGGPNLLEAVRLALQRASKDDRFGRTLLGTDPDDVAIELWIETERVQFSGDCSTWAEQLRLGQDGVRVSIGAAHAYYKPSVALTSSVASVEELFEKLCRKASLPESSWKHPEASVQRTEWIHAVEVPSGFVLMQGLRPMPCRSPERTEILSAVSLCLRRMLANQRPDGTLGYLYYPFVDDWEEDTNCVRLAGCGYALARAADHRAVNPDHGPVHEAAVRLISSLLTRTAIRGASSNGLFIREPDSDESWGKLGATALTALAGQYSAGESSRDVSNALIETILELQNPEGSFTCGVGRKVDASAQNFYPGESLLALARYGRRTQDERAAAAIEKAFPYYKAHFHRQPASAFVLWQTDTWTRVAFWLLEGSFPRSGGAKSLTIEELCGFVFEQVDWLLSYQHTEEKGSPSNYIGGFKTPNPPTANSATYVEAIILACDAAAMFGDAERLRRYREAALLGLEFILRLQVLPEMTSFFQRPDLAVGAITKSLQSFEIRCDYDQHFVTACLTAVDSPNLWP